MVLQKEYGTMVYPIRGGGGLLGWSIIGNNGKGMVGFVGSIFYGSGTGLKTFSLEV